MQPALCQLTRVSLIFALIIRLASSSRRFTLAVSFSTLPTSLPISDLNVLQSHTAIQLFSRTLRTSWRTRAGIRERWPTEKSCRSRASGVRMERRERHVNESSCVYSCPCPTDLQEHHLQHYLHPMRQCAIFLLSTIVNVLL